MTRLTDQEIDEIARRIAATMGRDATPPPTTDNRQPTTGFEGALGVFATVSDAVRAATAAQTEFVKLKLAHRARIIEAMRQSMRENGAALARAGFFSAARRSSKMAGSYCCSARRSSARLIARSAELSARPACLSNCPIKL